MNKTPNIIWIIPDGIRAIKYNDPVGRLPFFDKFAKIATEYKRCYTSAPSTLMSFISQFTGISPVYFANEYNTIKKTKLNGIESIQTVIEKAQYNSYFFSFYEPLRSMFDIFKNTETFIDDKNSFLNYYQMAFDGKDTRKYVVDNFLEQENMREPFCFFYHMNYYSENIHETFEYDFNADVEKLYEKLESKYDLDNCLILIHSDHGYPIYKGEANKEFMFTHDLLMSEENIRVPLFVKYPFSKQGDVVTDEKSLVDILPTIADEINISIKKELLHGVSLKKNIRQDDKDSLIRVDNRMFAQSGGRKTAIVKNGVKLVHDYDENKNELYYVDENCHEELFFDANVEEQYFKLLCADNEEREVHMAILKQLNMEAKIKAIKDKLVDCNRAIAIRLFDSIYFDEFMNIFLNVENIDIDDLDTLSSEECAILVLIDSVVSLNAELYTSVFSKLGLDMFKKVIIVDTFWNHEELFCEADNFLESKKIIYDYRQKRDRRGAIEKARYREEYFMFLDKQYVESFKG